MSAGVYAIRAPSGNLYVGSSIRMRARWMDHRRELRRGVHRNARLQAAFNKYGVALQFNVLMLCDSAQDVLICEQAAIDHIKPAYNILPTAGSSKGVVVSSVTRAKLSAIHKGRKRPPRSPEHCAAISAAKLGVATGPRSKQAKMNMSTAAKERWHRYREARSEQ